MGSAMGSFWNGQKSGPCIPKWHDEMISHAGLASLPLSSGLSFVFNPPSSILILL